jgi:hypothetical protein
MFAQFKSIAHSLPDYHPISAHSLWDYDEYRHAWSPTNGAQQINHTHIYIMYSLCTKVNSIITQEQAEGYYYKVLVYTPDMNAIHKFIVIS